MGGSIRTQELRVSAGPGMPRRDRGDLPGRQGRDPKRQWILDADLHGAFDHIDHEFVLDLIGSFPGRG